MEEGKKLLHLLERANYNYNKLDSVIQEEINFFKSAIREIESMSEVEFLRNYSIASKGYYINQFRNEIKWLEQVKKRVDYLIDLYLNHKSMFGWVLKHNYKGCIREMRAAIKRLANSKVCKNLLSFV